MLRSNSKSNSKSLGNHVVSSEEEKDRLQWEGFAETLLRYVVDLFYDFFSILTDTAGRAICLR